MNTQEINLQADIIDVRDIIERYEEIRVDIENEIGKDAGDFGSMEGFIDYAASEADNVSLVKEFNILNGILDELEGNGGDEEFRGAWYPITLIKDSYFTEYARDLVEDCGYIAPELPHWVEIDWEKTADNVKNDYTYMTIGESDYWYR